MNIYADRGNLLMLERRCAWRGIGFELVSSGLGESLDPDAGDLFYIGGGQDREQALVAHDLTGKASALQEAVESGAAFLAVCGGYQLLGRYYRDVAGEEQPGIGLLPLHTIADKRRMIGDVLLDCGWAGRTLAGFENHAGRTILDKGAEPLGRVVSGFGNDGESGHEGARYKRAYATYLHGPLLPRNPWFADHLLSEALAHAGGPTELTPLPDELEQEAHAVSAARARARGGKF
jgi:CobQ-like glutamine amidotransferase family enzyme